MVATAKFQRTDADVEEFLAAISNEQRRADARALVELMAGITGEPPAVWGGNIVGFGERRYRYASGREGETCKLSIASNASYISLYCLAADADGYVAERYVDRLPKASVGKSCVRFKKLADLDESALVTLIKETAKMGFVA